jgi:hypothetical protein
LPTLQGVVAISWEYTHGKGLSLNTTLPANTQGTVIMPPGDWTSLREGGHLLWSSPSSENTAAAHGHTHPHPKPKPNPHPKTSSNNLSPTPTAYLDPSMIGASTARPRVNGISTVTVHADGVVKVPIGSGTYTFILHE